MLIITKEITRTLFPCLDAEGQLHYDEGGRVVCGHCYSIQGIKVRLIEGKGKRPRLHQTCMSCEAKEVTDNQTGEIISQSIDMMAIDRHKKSFLENYPQNKL